MSLTRIALGLILSASLSMQGHCEVPSFAMPQQQSVFRHIDPDDNLLHVQSKFTFPKQIANFKRGETTQYNDEGSDISVGYFNAASGIVTTIYVYPAHGALKDEFAARQAEIIHHHPNAVLISTLAAKTTPQEIDALTATYRYEESFLQKIQLVYSKLLVSRHGNYFVEYRFSCPAIMQTPAKADIISFESQFNWPH